MTNDQAKKVQSTLEMIAARIDSLSAAQMHNAMVNVDRAAQNFGKSWQEFRTFHFCPSGDQSHIWDDCTKEQMLSYVHHKMEMFAKHPYLAA
jgi:adenylate cyclase